MARGQPRKFHRFSKLKKRKGNSSFLRIRANLALTVGGGIGPVGGGSRQLRNSKALPAGPRRAVPLASSLRGGAPILERKKS
jgi:hypothetical protein